MKMLGRVARVCDDKGCTCNPGLSSTRRYYKRVAKRRERQAWKKETK